MQLNPCVAVMGGRAPLCALRKGERIGKAGSQLGLSGVNEVTVPIDDSASLRSSNNAPVETVGRDTENTLSIAECEALCVFKAQQLRHDMNGPLAEEAEKVNDENCKTYASK